ncbi:hypothetical protein [Paraburkholderia caballeronis]|uniref:Uncharacterized protein n=1 Tax=Paraburkholderia caballeronis TaxID=416943 RepID=A0A1H7GVI5_9BURK|nr:hypothetical protein [Paraburkholderia caballeronis]PXW29749.1 hypothetical protein C7403_101607 [Paraburkholderia caballeronis]PXX05008.1 hypothetical protein C7407_101607 [Paraburkholderia caballeronis]RAK06069.1 hypothetical protein C7409_101607 [Paraburkholderia caballeronis]SEB47996.1 hypothetical protein SAMN05445871_0286 [Paraburkholderia caballeronis]SEK42193.1 hypothetical protein SAMN05192542_10229 [Paraburkholderia caballeronis]
MESISWFWPWMESNFGKNAATVLFTNFFAALFAALLIRLCSKLAPDLNSRFQNYLIFCLGALLGWGLGMFLAPYGAQDQTAFAQMGQLASVFISGYALSKFDRFIEASMFDEKKPRVDSWIKVGLFVATALLALLTVVTNRLYFRPDGISEQFNFSLGGEVVTHKYSIANLSDAVYVDLLRSEDVAPRR